MRQHHDLKLHVDYFQDVADGRKTFEIRYNDRNFKRSDSVALKEWTGESYTGRELEFVIGYVTAFAQKEGWVVFSLKEIK